MNAEPAILLDVSRLVSRIGTGPLTGIDRVEAEWLAHLAGRNHLLLCRVSGGQALLPPEAGAAIQRWIGGDSAGLPRHPGWRDRLAGRDHAPARAQAALRGMAIMVAPASGRGLVKAVEARLGAAAYLNVGHSNLASALLANLAGLQRVVMIHDTIPLDHPEFTRAGQSGKFRTRLMAALSLADTIVAISDATAARIEIWRGRLAITRKPRILTAHIGTRLAAPDPAAIPADLKTAPPFFVTLGTIEPRKNHALLLDAWDLLARRLPQGQVPQLLILGRRGWENREVFARLDRLGPDSPLVERAGLSDAAVAALLVRSHGLLMPSLAEGFGLPLTEAAARGLPVICAPLPSTRELLGDYPHYLAPDRPADWAYALAEAALAQRIVLKSLAVPTWGRHFELIERAIALPHNRPG